LQNQLVLDSLEGSLAFFGVSFFFLVLKGVFLNFATELALVKGHGNFPAVFASDTGVDFSNKLVHVY
jgi:hypothetical protein